MLHYATANARFFYEKMKGFYAGSWGRETMIVY
jgi:hypothetical protein